MTRFSLVALLLAISLLLGACGPQDLFRPSSFQDGVPQTTPLHDGVTQTTPLVMGEVRLASGEPAVGVKVSAYVSEYQLASTGSGANRKETTTDAQGRYTFTDPPLGLNTIEAEASPDAKALRLNVAVVKGARLYLEPLVLQPTGTITGKVTADAPINLTGTIVFIPGTHYIAVTGADGEFALPHVPVGTYQVAAMRQNYHTVVVSGVQVRPQETVRAPNLTLTLDAPLLESLSQANGGPGTELILRGQNFGASKNTSLMVMFGNKLATEFRRISDTEIRVWVPEGAVNGPVVVYSNGVGSNGLEFQVIAQLRVRPYYAALFVGERQTFDVEALDVKGEVIPDPVIRWELGADFLGSLSEAGELVTQEPGWSEIRARSGALTGLGAVGVTPFSATSSLTKVMALTGQPGQIVSTTTGLYFTHPAGGRIYVEKPGDGRDVLAGTGSTDGEASPDGTPAHEANLVLPDGLAVDARGNVFFSERGSHRIRVIPHADTLFRGRTLKAGEVYTLAGTGAAGSKADGPDATLIPLNGPCGLVLGNGDASGFLSGGLVFVESGHRRIRELRSDGSIVTLVGGGGQQATTSGTPGTDYGGRVGYYLARDPEGNLAFSTESQVLFYCRVSGVYFGRSMEAGKVYVVAGQKSSGFNGDGPGTSVLLYAPYGLAFDAAGYLYISDVGNEAVRVLTPSGHVRWVAGVRLPFGYTNVPSPTGDLPATSVRLVPNTLAVRADGTLLVGDSIYLNILALHPFVSW